MSKRIADPTVDNIDKKLVQLCPIPSERCIFKVYHELRKVNEKAYEPKVLAIGPYHLAKGKGKANLKPMEEHKLRYLQQLLKRRNEISVERYVVAMRESVESARKFYAEPINLGADEFVEMMLLDSCFIVELLRKHVIDELREEDDPIFRFARIRFFLQRDLMLLENQLPFFILVQFFNMTKIANSLDNIIDMPLLFFKNIVLPRQHLGPPSYGFLMEEIKHLLGLVHYCWCYPFQSVLSTRNDEFEKLKNERFMKSVTELQEDGIKFMKFEGRILFDVRFKNGRVEIPPIKFDDSTESLFRNLIAYEQYLPNSCLQYFSSYIVFLHNLINSSKDVEILRQLGIIRNYLADDETVSSISNKLGDNVFVSPCFDKCYSKLLNDVNKHCSQRRNVWMAKLRRDYFNTPWALISFVAAVVLLLLTVTQTIFSILSVV